MTNETTVNCDYCGEQALLVSGEVIYPSRSDLGNLWFYQCKPCNAYVGSHKGSNKPLGRLANKELRKAKMAAHRSFDYIWTSEKMKRAKAYSWLAKQLGIPASECHIGMFDVDTCNKVVTTCGVYHDK